ncbi:MAG TPA: class I SAM-dependent methyltransferase [Candidatus Acidoferrales bacterium]|jgi:extracellular factor (EF) 3-hydroxypalmitic acid methyl ester biosynthesis protein|nr:class I SAM-dependent methyltransferase [Candidatus Acidoferrales bacterium]
MSIAAKSNGNLTRLSEKKAAKARPASPAQGGAPGNEVSFQAADGVELRANLGRLTPYVATFDAGHLPTALRASEVLNNFKITSGNRVIYFGRAVVSNVIHTDASLFCEAKLVSLGSETAFFLPPTEPPSNLNEAYDVFFQTWQNNYRISAEFKVLVTDVQSYLTGVRHWLEGLEFGLKAQSDREKQERAILDVIAPRIIDAFNRQHERFEEMIYALPPESRMAHQDFVRKHWQKIFLGSPFGHRTFHKPNGYAGDYEMMNMIYRNQPEGGSLFEKLIHLLLVSQWPARSVRNRIAHLRENILNETARVARSDKTARIMNIGCGAAKEVHDFLKDTHLSDSADFTLVDFNEETLSFAGGKLAEAKREFSRRTTVRTQQMSVYELLKRSRQNDPDREKFDLIYCAGLFDYLPPDTCRALMGLWYDSLLPGGLMLIANMHDAKPFRNFIEFVLDWQLIYRDSREFASLVPAQCRETTQVIAEPTSVNLFLHVRKPD